MGVKQKDRGGNVWGKREIAIWVGQGQEWELFRNKHHADPFKVSGTIHTFQIGHMLSGVPD